MHIMKSRLKSHNLSKLSETYGRSRVPLYVQVASVLRTRIQSGFWSAGDKIPTLEELEREFEVARVTIRQAVDILREEGLLQARQGLGTFVSLKTQDRHWVKLASNWSSLIESLKDNVPQLLAFDENAAPPELTGSGGQPALKYAWLRSVQYRNKEPFSAVSLYLARDVFDRAPQRFKSAAALVTIDAMDEITLTEAHQTLTIGNADPELADLLRIPIGAPTLESRCIVIDDRGVAIYVGDIVYRSESIKVQMDLLGTAPLRRARLQNGGKVAATPQPKTAKE
jgi:GntR family transcriptional regulator